MNILKEYTLDYVKRNKKSSMTIMIALLIATILMNTLVSSFYVLWDSKINQVLQLEGNWHGELREEILGEDLKYIKSYASVEEVLVKGQWYVAKVGDPKRPYLIMRDANKAYWESMYEQHLITEGSVPKQTGEIVVSKQFMAAHPEYQIGDQVTLPIGQRSYEGEVIEPVSAWIEGEKFTAKQDITYTITGVLDITTASAIPAYTGIGYLEEETIKPKDQLTTYVRFHNMRSTYKELPELAAALGCTKDEYGEYDLKYHTNLLKGYCIFPKIDTSLPLPRLLMSLLTPMFYMGVIVLVIGLFVFIIKNAFETSMNHRKKQLGMFKSIGATPKQIKSSITYEAVILAIIPILVGIIVSKVVSYWFIGQMNGYNEVFGYELLGYKMNIGLEVLIVVMIFGIAWLSAYIPSRKVNGKMPIEILREESISTTLKKHKKKKQKNKRYAKLFGTKNIYRALARNQYKAYKKSFRISIISLTLSLLVFMFFLTGIGSGNLSNDIFYKENNYNLKVYLLDGNSMDENVKKAIVHNDKIKKHTMMSACRGTLWISGEKASDAIEEQGGLEAMVGYYKHNMLQRDNMYRIGTMMLALDDNSFNEYCEQMGLDWKPYYEEGNQRTVIYNQVVGTWDMSIRNPEKVEYLKLQEGEKLVVSEKCLDEDEGNGEIEIEVGDIVNQFPIIDLSYSRNLLVQIMPNSTYERIIGQYSSNKQMGAKKVDVQMQVDEADIEQVASWLEEECEKRYGEGDFYIWNPIEIEREDKAGDQITKLTIWFVSGLFAIIGLSNAFFTIYTSLQQRKRSFSIFRSVGVTPRGINQILFYEAMGFALKPICYATIMEVLWIQFIVSIQESSWSEFLGYVPIGSFIIFDLLLILTIAGAYFIGSYRIRTQNIVESIKDEMI